MPPHLVKPFLFLAFQRFIFVFNFVYCCYFHECRCLHGPEEGVECPRAGVIDGCELPDVGAGN